MTSHPLVSVVTPSYNQAQFIEETLASVALQRYRPIHQVVVDGGSTDGTVELLRSWEAADHGPGYTFEWVSEPDRGHADALNKGFDRARGEIVGWLNSDDVYFDRRAIETSVAAFASHPEVDLVHGDVALISETGGLQMIWCFPEFDYRRIQRGYLIPQPTVFFRRSVVDRHRLDASLKFAIDHVYWLEIGRTHKALKIPRVQAADRDHRARISQVSHAAMKQASAAAMAESAAGPQADPLSQAGDCLLRILFRLRGLMHLVSFLMRRGQADRLAFPVWVDSAPRAIARQLTMRLNKRTEMGLRPSPVNCARCAPS